MAHTSRGVVIDSDVVRPETRGPTPVRRGRWPAPRRRDEREHARLSSVQRGGGGGVGAARLRGRAGGEAHCANLPNPYPPRAAKFPRRTRRITDGGTVALACRGHAPAFFVSCIPNRRRKPEWPKAFLELLRKFPVPDDRGRDGSGLRVRGGGIRDVLRCDGDRVAILRWPDGDRLRGGLPPGRRDHRPLGSAGSPVRGRGGRGARNGAIR